MLYEQRLSETWFVCYVLLTIKKWSNFVPLASMLELQETDFWDLTLLHYVWLWLFTTNSYHPHIFD
jgi:hypothetical protein